jgi:hypothetical protein
MPGRLEFSTKVHAQEVALYNRNCELMPTILFVQGWRFHFFSNEGNEPMHVHAVKGEAECKYWLHPDAFDIDEEFEYNCTPR